MGIKAWGILASAFVLATVAGAQVTAPATCRTIATDAQDALIASPANHTVLFENADVRVLDIHSQPHKREAVHTHVRPSVMYIDRQGAGTYDTPDGRDHRSHPTDPNFKPRIVAIKPEGPHWTENTGEVPFHAIRVEFKHPGCGLPGWKAAVPAADDAVVAAPANHTVLFENADVRVLDVHLDPGAKEPEHTHPWPGLFYVVSAPPLKFYQPGKPPEPRTFPAGAKIVPIGAQGLHAAENVGDVPLHLIRFELKYGIQANDDFEAMKEELLQSQEFPRLKERAKAGGAMEQFQVGYCYEVGRQVPQHYSQAAQWYRKSAEQGFAAAQYSLGMLYEKRLGLPQDYKRAYFWLSLAASAYSERDGGLSAQVASHRDSAAKHLSSSTLLDLQRQVTEYLSTHRKPY